MSAGTDSRSTYYNKWDALARSAVDEAEADDEKERDEATAALGLTAPRSQAEAEDAAARVALKEAKKRWTEREKQEQALKYVVTREGSDETVVDVGEKRVVCIARCKECTITLSRSAAEVVKVFVEDCTDVTILVECRLVTSFVDMSRCTRVRLVATETLHTIQCDLSDGVDLELPDSFAKVYHAGAKNLTVTLGGNKEVFEDYQSRVAENAPAEEQQFVTHVVDGEVMSERLNRSTSTHLIGATEREMNEAEAVKEREKEIEKERTTGNDCFRRCEYGQAAVHYTLALDSMIGQPKSIVLANRAACFLKLGEPEKALVDATAAIELDPHYCKAHFRKGLALHALHRYKEALPALGKARDIEPKNSQIHDAIRFAEMRLAKGG